MSTNRKIAALKAGALELDCLEMSLIQEGTSSPISYRGKGYIRQADGKLSLKLYASETTKTDMFDSLQRDESWVAGKLLPDDAYYSLQATEADGTEWRGRRLLVDCSWLAGNPNPIVVADFNLIESLSPSIGTGHRLWLHFFEEVNFPYLEAIETITPYSRISQLGRTSFQASGCAFEIKRDGRGFRIEVEAEEALPPDLAMVVQGALGYGLAQSVQWRVAEYFDGNEIRRRFRAVPARTERGRLQPAIPLGFVQRPAFWTHLIRYMDHALCPKTARRAKIMSLQLLSAREASAVSVDAWAIGVCLAVEGLSSFLKVERTRPV